MKKIYLALILAFSSMVSFSQELHRCSSHEYLERQMKNDPERKANVERLNQYIQENQHLYSGSNKAAAVITIPVVFHVVYANSTENISDARLMEQLTTLNKDYRRLNSDTTSTPAAFKPLGADSEIEFCLAKRDPNGNATTGITRTLTTVGSFADDDNVKNVRTGGQTAWNTSKYLNIWVCDLGSQLLGYAQFPGGDVNTDGVVLHYKYTGTTGATSPYNKGRTATHEVGHWLGLYHIWGDESACAADDNVTDTPQQKGENYGCPSYPQTSQAGGRCNTTDPSSMFMNYMDYVNDNCMNLFTTGQKVRMLAVLNGSRASLKTSDACTPIVLEANDAGIKKIVAPESGICNATATPSVILKNFGTNTLTSATINYKINNSGSVNTQNWNGSLTSLAETTVAIPSVTLNDGDTLYAFTTLPNGVADDNTSNDLNKKKLKVFATTVYPPVVYDFTSTTFQTGWGVEDVDSDARVWTRSGTIGFSGNNSIRMNNFSGPDYRGRLDHFLTPNVNLTGTNNMATLSFYVAYAPYNTQFVDTLMVYASTNCGETWNKIYQKGGNDLKTSNAIITAYNPGSTASNWRRDSIDISGFIGQNARFRFTNKSGYGNNLYMDNINIKSYLINGAKQISLTKDEIKLYPNPATNVLVIENNTNGTTNYVVENILGEKVLEVKSTTFKTELDISGLSNGSYIVKSISDNIVTKHKIIKL